MYNRRLDDGHPERQTGKRGSSRLRAHIRGPGGRSRISVPGISVSRCSVSGGVPVPVPVSVSATAATAAAVPRTGVRTAVPAGRRRRDTGAAVLRAVLLPRSVTVAVLSRGTVAVPPSGVPVGTAVTVRTVYRGGRVPLAAAAVPAPAAATGRTVSAVLQTARRRAVAVLL